MKLIIKHFFGFTWWLLKGLGEGLAGLCLVLLVGAGALLMTGIPALAIYFDYQKPGWAIIAAMAGLACWFVVYFYHHYED